MNKNLSIVNQNNKLMLKKSKSLMSITNSILDYDDWIQRLWDWADENNIPDYDLYENDDGDENMLGLPRDTNILKNLTGFTLDRSYFSELQDVKYNTI